MLLYIADNLACFPYQTQEEPLFIMHHIDITLSVSGSNLLQSFKEVSVFVMLCSHHNSVSLSGLLNLSIAVNMNKYHYFSDNSKNLLCPVCDMSVNNVYNLIDF